MPDIQKLKIFTFILEVNLIDTATTTEHTFRTFYVVTKLDSQQYLHLSSFALNINGAESNLDMVY